MGYTTEFNGRFNLDKQLTDTDMEFLSKLASTRRMKRNVDPEYGVEGEFFVDGKGFMGQDHNDETIIDYNNPPSTQPSLWCQWVPTSDRRGIEWDCGEKFYGYDEWLQYICDKILAPKGYILNGAVEFRGEDWVDAGLLICEDNKVRIQYNNPKVNIKTTRR